MTRGAELRAGLLAHRDLISLVAVLLAAILIRLAFTFRVPLLVTGDSESYLVPAYGLVHGQGLDLSLKRTPVYPLLVAGSLAMQGDDLQSLAVLQHLIGLGTVVCAWWLGQALFGRVAGIAAGLATGVSGPQLLAEHSLMTEAIFVPLIALTAVLLVGALRRRSLPLMIVAGAVLGLTTLARPVALAIVPLMAFAALLGWRVRREQLTAAVLGIGACAIILGAWSLRSGRTEDSGGVGGLGQTLIGRTARHDRGAFTFWDPALHADETPARQQARRTLQEAADRGSSGRAVHTRLRKDLGLSAAEADALMRDLAIDAIRRDFGYYTQGTLQRFVRLAQPVMERLRDDRNANDVARQRWEDEPTRSLINQTNSSFDNEAAAAEGIVGLWQPGRLSVAWPLLALVGVALAAAGPARGGALLLAGMGGILLFVSAALVGNVPRYRYPVDPLAAALVCGAMTSTTGLVLRRLKVRGITGTGSLRPDSRTEPIG